MEQRATKNEAVEIVEIQISTESKTDILEEETGDNTSRNKGRSYDEDVLNNRRAFGMSIIGV